MTSDLENLLQLLRSWMNEHRQSILSGTVSCKDCRALVLEENSASHTSWHRLHARQHNDHYGYGVQS